MNSINNNLMALNTANTLNGHYSRLATSVERLSTGLRVNSSADDAAGLAIRELMRADIAATAQGARNANDAISLIQVADGALGIIDEKLIRMKELAEQAATGTYDSTQRLMIDSEFQAMASEIERIARATEFNGIKLLDGSRQGDHDGSGLEATGKLKIHFGSGNDSAEDYYYLDIADCTLAGLGLRESKEKGAVNYIHDPDAQEAIQSVASMGKINKSPQSMRAQNSHEGSIWESGIELPAMNDAPPYGDGPDVIRPYGRLETLDNLFAGLDEWAQTVETGRTGTLHKYDGNFMFLIPAGSKNVLINMLSCQPISPEKIIVGDNDIQLFTKTGIHLAGTPLDDFVYKASYQTSIDYNKNVFGFDSSQYDGSLLNSGPAQYDYGATLSYSTYNGMTIGYSGDADRQDIVPNDGKPSILDYETLTIDVVTEDLIIWFPGAAGIQIKAYNNLPDLQTIPDPPDPPFPPAFPPDAPPDAPPDTPPGIDNFIQGDIISIKTQEKAQQALTRINDAIVAKDKVRAHLGAMQNRLENTVSNLSIQGENLQAAESRISDTDVATEMTQFVRNQVLTQSAVAMLGQANSYPHMLAGLLNG